MAKVFDTPPYYLALDFIGIALRDGKMAKFLSSRTELPPESQSISCANFAHTYWLFCQRQESICCADFPLRLPPPPLLIFDQSFYPGGACSEFLIELRMPPVTHCKVSRRDEGQAYSPSILLRATSMRATPKAGSVSAV